MNKSTVMGRRLGNFERYCLMDMNLGHPSIVAFVATLPSATADNLTDRLLPAIAHLLARYPLLSASVPARYSHQPAFSTRTVEPHEIPSASDFVTEGLSEGTLLARIMAEGAKMDIEKGPLWAVSVSGSAPAKITLVINHILGDGTSSRNLFAELLRLLSAPVPPLPTTGTALALPPTMEATLNTRPPASLLLHALVYELIAPALPKAIRPIVSPYFPNPPPPYKDYSTSVRVVHFPPETINSLKSAGKANGVSTLHPLLNTIAFAAFALSLSSSTSSPFASTPLRSSTPISLRDSTLGHPEVTGNYLATLPLPEKISPSSTFFGHCRHYAQQLHSKSGRRLALGELGLLALVPNPKPKAGATETGWEKLFGEAARSETPFRSSMAVSNLGVLAVPEAFERAQVVWSQTCSPIVAPIALNILSSKTGMTVTCASLEASLPKGFLDLFWTNFEALVYKVARGEVVEGSLIKDMLVL